MSRNRTSQVASREPRKREILLTSGNVPAVFSEHLLNRILGQSDRCAAAQKPEAGATLAEMSRVESQPAVTGFHNMAQVALAISQAADCFGIFPRRRTDDYRCGRIDRLRQ
jgi:hypothetical protein